MDMEHLCMGCMRDKGEEAVCPYCGYSDDEKQIYCYLPSRTVIAKRYLVGRVLSYNGESVTYMGYDAVGGRRVRIQEYFPDALVLRGDDQHTVIVKSDCNIAFKSCMSDFVDLMEQLFRMKDFSSIMRVWDIEYQNNTVYAVLEYVDGAPLRYFLEKRRLMLTWDETMEIMRPVMKTVEALHNEGIIHRGISIDTIWLGANRTVKLDGFAISEVRAARTDLNPEFFRGFTAPEQYSAVSPHGTWTDVYGLCAVLYTCLTGGAPIDALIRSSTEELMPPREKNETVPQRASRAILQGLSMDINERIETVSALIARIVGPGVEDLTSEAPTLHAAAAKNEPKKVEAKQRQKKQQAPAAIKTSVSGKKVTPSSSVKKRGGFFKAKWSGRFTAPLLFILSIAAALLVMYLIVWSVIKPSDAPPKTSSLVTTEPSYEPSSGQLPVNGNGETSQDSSQNSTFIPSSEASSEEEYITMDNFVGLFYEDVITNSGYLDKYVFAEPVESYSDEYEAGKVINQSIVAGNVTQRGSSVVLKVSKGSRYAMIPYVEGMTKELYLAKLEEQGILYSVIEEPSSTVSAGYVIGTDYLAGTKYDRESGLQIEVYVSSGAPVLPESSEDPSSQNPGQMDGPGGPIAPPVE